MKPFSVLLLGWLPFVVSSNEGLFGRQDTSPNLGPTSTGPASSPAPTPIIDFETINQMTACQPSHFGWFYGGPSGLSLSITVSNTGINAPQTDGLNPRDNAPSIWETIGSDIDPASDGFVWSSVNVPQGSYIFIMNVNGTMFTSPLFNVVNGSDTSCLDSTSSSTTVTSSLPSTSSSSSSTSLPTTSQTATGDALPVSAASTGSGVNKRAIAGGVIGGLAVLAALIAALFFYRYRSTKGNVRKWGNLGSFDAKSAPHPKSPAMYNGTGVTGVGLAALGLGAADSRRRVPQGARHHSQTDSTGPINVYSATPGASEENFSPYDEKYTRSPFSDPGHSDAEEVGMVPIAYDTSPSATEASVGHATKHSSASSSASSHQPRPQYKSTPSPQTFPETPRNLSTGTLESTRRASSPQLPSHSSASDPSGRVTHSPIYGVIGVESRSAPVTPTTRKTPRKPVPAYSPDVSARLDVPTDIKDSDASAEGVPVLNHKGSFKQMHYLIPDMPPPQRD